MNPCFETATRLARAIRNGRLSSVEATEAGAVTLGKTNVPELCADFQVAAVSAKTLTSGLPSMNAMRRSLGFAAGASPSGTVAPSAS